jgi:hypothetical protein
MLTRLGDAGAVGITGASRRAAQHAPPQRRVRIPGAAPGLYPRDGWLTPAADAAHGGSPHRRCAVRLGCQARMIDHRPHTNGRPRRGTGWPRRPPWRARLCTKQAGNLLWPGFACATMASFGAPAADRHRPPSMRSCGVAGEHLSRAPPATRSLAYARARLRREVDEAAERPGQIFGEVAAQPADRARIAGRKKNRRCRDRHCPYPAISTSQHTVWTCGASAAACCCRQPTWSRKEVRSDRVTSASRRWRSHDLLFAWKACNIESNAIIAGESGRRRWRGTDGRVYSFIAAVIARAKLARVLASTCPSRRRDGGQGGRRSFSRALDATRVFVATAWPHRFLGSPLRHLTATWRRASPSRQPPSRAWHHRCRRGGLLL